MRIIARIVLAAMALYAILVGGLAVAMRQPPDTFGQIMARMPGPAFMLLPFQRLWLNARAGKLQVGQIAPDFSLRSLNANGMSADSTVRLSSFRGQRPVVLVFGSYT